MSATKSKGGLGRGLGALIPTGPAQPDAPPPPAITPTGPPATPASTKTTPPQATSPATPATAAATATATKAAVTEPVVPAQPAPPASAPQADKSQELQPVPGARFAEIPVGSIMPNPKQPRQVFDDEQLDELKISIVEVGFLQPIVVREMGQDKYELVMGERRWRAAQAIGRELIPAIIRDTRDDAMLRDALLENIHRAQLNPLEEAAAYQQLLEEFGATHDELARKIGRSRPQISNTIRLLNLPPQVQRRVAAGVISAGHARALLSLEDSAKQESLAAKIVQEGLSVRATEELVTLEISGGPSKQAAQKRRAKPHAPALADLAERLSDRFDTRVRVDIGRSKGKITIEFATVDDLERIVGIIGVEKQ